MLMLRYLHGKLLAPNNHQITSFCREMAWSFITIVLEFRTGMIMDGPKSWWLVGMKSMIQGSNIFVAIHPFPHMVEPVVRAVVLVVSVGCSFCAASRSCLDQRFVSREEKRFSLISVLQNPSACPGAC